MFISRRDRYQPSRDGDPCELPHPWTVSQPKTHGPRRVFPHLWRLKGRGKKGTTARTDRLDHDHDHDCTRSIEWRFLGRAARRPPVSLRSVEMDGHGDGRDEALCMCVCVLACLLACFSVTMILLLLLLLLLLPMLLHDKELLRWRLGVPIARLAIPIVVCLLDTTQPLLLYTAGPLIVSTTRLPSF